MPLPVIVRELPAATTMLPLLVVLPFRVMVWLVRPMVTLVAAVVPMFTLATDSRAKSPTEVLIWLVALPVRLTMPVC